jgi:diaminohydroxyphosphoribosylaminopyrimidine deaminase/5-amino-6-(5-phosphoribosylamino)uracil reductase
MSSFSDLDRQHMRRALDLARRGLGRVEPNPLVGAVLADGPRIIAQGFHACFGGPHAEVAALAEAAESARGATLYVTLEPCAHFGKTPPCAPAVAAAGVRRVVAAMTDPFPEVSGRGFDQLRAAGLQVEVGLMEEEARRLNAPFIKLHTKHRPYVTVKWAMTIDGRLAASSGDSRWISSTESRSWVHTLRSRVDCLCVGAATVRFDNPLLTVRLDEGATNYGRRPVRLVLDSKLSIPLTSQLVATAAQSPVLVATALPLSDSRAQALSARGVEVISFPIDPDGRVPLAPLLDELGCRRMTNLLVEGGPSVLSSFFQAAEIDALAIFIAPKFLGGPPTHLAPGPTGLTLMRDALPLLRPTYTPVGGDLLVQGVLRDY